MLAIALGADFCEGADVGARCVVFGFFEEREFIECALERRGLALLVLEHVLADALPGWHIEVSRCGCHLVLL